MVDLKDFRGFFGDFQTLDHDVDLKKFVMCSYGPDGKTETYKVIIGCTILPYDVLLHVIDVEDAEDNVDIDNHIENHGVQLVFLKDFIGAFGVEIHPDFQFDSNQKQADFD